MKYLLLLLVLASCSSTPEKTSEVPSTPVVVAPEIAKDPAYSDKDCGQMVPANFKTLVLKHISNKTNITKQDSRIAYWQAFFKSMAKAESCLKPATRYVETGLGKDRVTGQQNTSEGFFQMSYQDALFHGCKFDWANDKKLKTSDLSKTIFDLENQIECAAIVLDKQLKTGKLYRPYYWSVLNPSTSGYKRFKKYLTSEGF